MRNWKPKRQEYYLDTQLAERNNLITQCNSDGIYFRWNVVQYFIDHFNYESYLEIGVHRGQTHEKIRIKHKDGVQIKLQASLYDPTKLYEVKYVMSSDDFFDTMADGRTWDIIFIDGDHSKEQVKKDILNALDHLNENGTLVVHDINIPSSDLMHSAACGDGWKAFVELRITRSDLFMFALPIDYVGGIRRGEQKLYDDPDTRSTWDYYIKNRVKLLNVLTEEEFYKLFPEKI